MEHVPGHAAKDDAGKTGSTARPHHDEIGVHICYGSDDLRRRVARSHGRFGLPTVPHRG